MEDSLQKRNLHRISKEPETPMEEKKLQKSQRKKNTRITSEEPGNT